MKRKIYTKSHNIELLKEINNNGNQFTAEEHAYVVEKEFSDTVSKTKATLLRYYLPIYLSQLGALGFLIERITKSRNKNILSLGAGPCVLEYFLKLSLPEETDVIATDFDAYLIDKAKSFFPEITSVTFDFFKDNIATLQNDLNVNFDMAIFFGSAYVMDDEFLIDFLRKLKKAGVKEIVDFHAGYMDWKGIVLNLLTPITQNSLIRKILRKPPIDGYIGNFHGYSRSRSELRRLYRKADLEIYEEISVPGYKYVAILS